MEERGDKSKGREIDVKWSVIEGRRKCEAACGHCDGEKELRETREVLGDGGRERRAAGKMLWLVFCRQRATLPNYSSAAPILD